MGKMLKKCPFCGGSAEMGDDIVHLTCCTEGLYIPLSVWQRRPVNKKKAVSYSLDVLALTEFLVFTMKQKFPEHRHWLDVKKCMENWMPDIDKLLRIDKRHYDEIRVVIEWVYKDDFWAGNILSAKKLREKYDVLVIRMKHKPKENSSHYEEL